jgi:hypothetical protein
MVGKVGKMIRRSPRPDNHYTVISNDTLRDERLSYRARGLLAVILSRPDNWRIRSEQLALEGKEGRDAIRTALNELKTCGYLHVEITRDSEGKLSSEQVIYDHPVTKPQVAPETENQLLENRPPDSQAPLEQTKRKNSKKSSSSVDDGFNQFWQLYPRKVGKDGAHTAFKRAIKKTSLETILAGLHLYNLTRPKETHYIAHPTTWLNQGRWADEQENLHTTNNPDPQPVWQPCGNCWNGWIEQPDNTLAPCPCTKGQP